MKVSAQPFEPPSATFSDAADVARADQRHHSQESVQPVESIQTQLNPATRESLSKLAILIRSQMRANEVAVEEAEEESKEKSKLKLVTGDARETEETLAEESIRPEAFPSVLRATEMLRAADRRRGFGVYGQQKSNALVELVIKELAERAEAEDKAAA
jgi:hypothetical protein